MREGTRITHHPTAGPRVGGTSASVSMSPAPTSALWVNPADSRPKPSRHPTPPPRWPLGPIGRMRRAVRGSHIRSRLGSAAGVAPRPGALRSDALEAEVPAVATWPSPLASSASGARPPPQSFVGCMCVCWERCHRRWRWQNNVVPHHGLRRAAVSGCPCPPARQPSPRWLSSSVPGSPAAAQVPPASAAPLPSRCVGTGVGPSLSAGSGHSPGVGDWTWGERAEFQP